MGRGGARICPGVSSTTPLGGTSTPSHRGSAAWHMEQRDSTTFSTSAKSAPDGSAAVSRRVAGCALSQTMATSPAAAAAQVHHGPLPVLCQIGRAHVWTPVTNAHLVCRLLLEKYKIQPSTHHNSIHNL